MSRRGMLLTSRNNTRRGRRAIHLPSLQTKPLSHLERRLPWGIAVTRGEGNKQVQLWLEAFLKTSDHLVDQDTWGEFQVVTDSEFALVMK